MKKTKILTGIALAFIGLSSFNVSADVRYNQIDDNMIKEKYKHYTSQEMTAEELEDFKIQYYKQVNDISFNIIGAGNGRDLAHFSLKVDNIDYTRPIHYSVYSDKDDSIIYKQNGKLFFDNNENIKFANGLNSDKVKFSYVESEGIWLIYVPKDNVNKNPNKSKDIYFKVDAYDKTGKRLTSIYDITSL